jgi:hypothetical protein
MRRNCLVMIAAVLGCVLQGCGAEQTSAPPAVAGNLPPDPMAGSTVPKKPIKGGGGHALPGLPSMPGGGIPK